MGAAMSVIETGQGAAAARVRPSPAEILLGEPLWSAERLGHSIPDSPHATSVCLPQWQDVIDYEERNPRVIGKLRCGYPRFFLHPKVEELFAEAERKFVKAGEKAFVFPSPEVAKRCAEFVRGESNEEIGGVRMEDFGWQRLTVIVVPERLQKFAVKFWQHGGEIISSRLAEAALDGRCVSDQCVREGQDAQSAIKKKLASLYNEPPNNVFLFCTGMAGIFAVHRVLGEIREGLKSVQVEFPYVDAFKVQEKFGSRSAR